MPSAMTAKPKLAVFKFASCDGCQLSLLDAKTNCWRSPASVDDRLFSGSHQPHRTGPVRRGPGRRFDHHASTTPSGFRKSGASKVPGDDRRLRHRRRHSGPAQLGRPRRVCAGRVRPARLHPARWPPRPPSPITCRSISSCAAARSTSINWSKCCLSLLAGKRPRTPVHSVCLDCKRRGTVCVMVAQGIPCLGPVTHAGCGAICPAYDRGCYGCYGPAEQPNLVSLTGQFAVRRGSAARGDRPRLRGFNGYAPEFRAESDRLSAGPASRAHDEQRRKNHRQNKQRSRVRSASKR